MIICVGESGSVRVGRTESRKKNFGLPHNSGGDWERTGSKAGNGTFHFICFFFRSQKSKFAETV